jgi:hypothetical protein
MGFGTQAIWLGPAQINPIIHSNNAASYPKLDLGIRKQAVTIPRVNWYIGDIEARAWWGYLSESDFFDNDSANDHNLITGFSFAYSFPSLLKGFTIGLNRVMLSKWSDFGLKPIFTLLWPFMSTDAGSDRNDQRASIVLDYMVPKVQLDIYLEWARNDFSPKLDHVIRYPFHTRAYTFGIKKVLPLTDSLKGEILLELSSLESSRDATLWPGSTSFYVHHIVRQGHTNQGQWLGAGLGTGGNSQYLGFKLYFPRGYGQFFIQRRNPDLDYTWYIDSEKYPETYQDGSPTYIAERNIRAFLDFGLSGLYYITRDLSVTGSMVFRDEHNPLNEGMVLKDPSIENSSHRFNFYCSVGFRFSI